MEDPRVSTGWESVVAALVAEGVKRVYGLPGDPVHLYDALYDVPAIQAILVRHECSGVFMAMAEARLTGEVTVCHGSPGPGTTNLVSGLNEALSSCSPLVCITSSAPASLVGMGAFQELDVQRLAAPVTKWSVRVDRVERIPWAMRRAFSIARHGVPGPVLVEIPVDVGLARWEAGPYRPGPALEPAVGAAAAIEEAAGLLRAARRPVLVAGGGAVLARAGEELVALAEQEHIPLMTTFSGRGIVPEDHPLAFGLVGLYLTKPGKQVYDEADLLVTVGSRMEGFQSGDWQLYPDDARFLQIDLDPFAIGRNWLPDSAVVGDAKFAVRGLRRALSQDGGCREERSARLREAAAMKDEFARSVDRECAEAVSTPLKSKRIVHELNEVYGHDTVLVNENGGQDLWSYYHPYYRVLDAGHLVPMGEQTCMGAGVTGAIGAKLAWPDRKVVCVTGDGAFQMMPQELSTAVQYSAPVTWIVLDSRSLGWSKWSQQQRGGRYIATDFTAQPSISALARAHGCHAEEVSRPEDIRGALERALKATEGGTPAVVSFQVDTFDYSPGFRAFPGKAWED
jgi:acetolactate synthase I/II/III large subunit